MAAEGARDCKLVGVCRGVAGVEIIDFFDARLAKLLSYLTISLLNYSSFYLSVKGAFIHMPQLH